jgi:hypothetical protein
MNEDSSHPLVPSRPYLGLDYFRECDACLFTERDGEIDACADTLLRFNVKIFVLQGSTGAGKSSFLRAGLIPRLRGNRQKQIHFLSDGDCVIRCTSDPLKWIAVALTKSLHTNRFHLERPLSACPDLETLIGGERTTLAEAILLTVHALCKQLAGHLVLVLDQAEEVLTKASGESALDEPGKAFFYFLEEAYLRNIDMRIIVALRTEYYGRFRDELRIDDDWLSQRPRRGGIDSFLLRPLRDPKALARIILAPTNVNGGKTFNFHFDPEAVNRIVQDLLTYSAYGAVTPFLQIICAILYERVTPNDREISLADYIRLGDIRGIAQLYLERGIGIVLGTRTSAELRDKWLLLLYTLVSRQGGGTLVSEVESIGTLRENASKVGIDGDIEPVLKQMCEGTSPLLRGLPIDHPIHFSLKHDVLAVVLVRWNVKYTTNQEDQEQHREQRRKRIERNRKRALRWGTSAALLLLVIGWGLVAQGQQQERELASARLRYAVNPPRSDFGQSLLLLVDSLYATERNAVLNALLPERALHRQAVGQLRSTILRSPRFSGEYRAAGFDPAERRLLLLHKNGMALEELAMPADSASGALPGPTLLALPSKAAQDLKLHSVPPATGYINGIGPVALIGDNLYYWNAADRVATQVELTAKLPEVLRKAPLRRYEIANGALHVTANKPKTKQVMAMRLDRDDLMATTISAEAGRLATSGTIAPQPLFSNSAASADAYGYVTRENGKARLMVGRPGKPTDAFAIPQPIVPDFNEDISFAFVTGEPAAIIYRDKIGFHYLDFGHQPGAGRRPVATPLETGVSADTDELKPLKPYSPWVYSPLAGVRKDGKLKIAWITRGGVRTAELSSSEGGKVSSSSLFSGEPGGSRLQFSEDAKLLLIQQQPFYNTPMRVRVWDLSPERATFIAQAGVAKLIKIACAIVNDRQKNLPDPDQSSIELLRIAGRAELSCSTSGDTPP